jgi:polysaccharide biosynthesis/export protein
MFRRILCFLIVIVACQAASERQRSVNELEQFVATARTAGHSDEQIRRNAVAAGWGETAVIDAIKGGLQVPYDYQIGAGDVLQVNVWKEPDASVPAVVVRPDGRISLPLIKDVSVVGLTPKQAEVTIIQELGRFITDADVTVVVSAINSKRVYLLGALKKEGPLAYTYRMSVMQAISEGGGLTDYAKRKKIYVLRTEHGRQFRLPFNYDAVLKGEHMEMNVALLPDDTVVVPH